MQCHICGKKPTKAAKCPTCGHIPAYFCDGYLCQPSLWRTGPTEKPSSIALMNFKCENCDSELELEALPASFDTRVEPGKLFGFIGTYLLHGYGDHPPDGGAGYKFAIAHFLNTMAPETTGWTFLANGTLDNPKTHGNRPLIAMALSHNQAMGKNILITKAMEWVKSWLKGLLPFNVGLVPDSFYTSAMVVNKSYAVCENVPSNDMSIPQPLRGEGNYSSRATKTETDAIVAYMLDQKIQKRIGWPAFSVWDCNCFHNSGYIMGKYALDTAIAVSREVDPPVLIVNIDQHSDAGSKNQSIVSSDRWGYALAECYPNSSYLSVASAGKETAHQIETYYRPGDSAVATLRPLHIPGQNKFTNTHIGHLFTGSKQEKKAARDLLKAYWTLLLTKIYPNVEGRPGNFKFVYLTIDRDCMVGNLNQWGDVKAILQNYEQVAILADTILSTLVSTGARVVGFDVTGLPENHELLQCNLSKGEKAQPSKVLTDMRAELAAFQEVFRRHIITQ